MGYCAAVGLAIALRRLLNLSGPDDHPRFYFKRPPERVTAPCCGCRVDRKLTWLVHVSRLAPTPGTGWGCDGCGLPNNGAVALICDPCRALGNAVVIRDVCTAVANRSGRTPIELVERTAFDHRWERHPRKDWPPWVTTERGP
jgi:hypothetical protein